MMLGGETEEASTGSSGSLSSLKRTLVALDVGCLELFNNPKGELHSLSQQWKR